MGSMTSIAASAFNQMANRPSGYLIDVGYISDEACNSTQTHHVIPMELWRDPKSFLNDPHVRAVLDSVGGPENPLNKMVLPSTVAGAAASNLALHNGSHPVAYNDEVEKGLLAVQGTYNGMLAANGGLPSPQVDAVLLASMAALELSLRLRLDRSSGVPKPLMLSSKDPNFALATPEHQAAVLTLGSIVEDVHENARAAYPSNSSAERACENARQLTAEQLRETAMKLREAAWAGVPEGDRPDDIRGGVLAQEQIAQQLPQMKEQTIAEILERTAQEHPYKAAMAGVGVVMMAGAGAVAAAGAEGLAVAGAAVRGAVQAANRAVVSATSTLVPTAAMALPDYNSLNAGRDDMGERSSVDHVSWRFTGIPAGEAGNSLAELHVRDTAPDREGGALAHCGAHLLVRADGSIERDTTYGRPMSLNPQIDAGQNGNALGIYVEGEGSLTDAQRKTLTELNDTLSQQRLQAGELTRSTLTPSGVREDAAWETQNSPVSPSLLARPAVRPAPLAAAGF